MSAAPAGLEVTFANYPDDGETVTVRTMLITRRFNLTERASQTEINAVTDRAIEEVKATVREMVAEWDELS